MYRFNEFLTSAAVGGQTMILEGGRNAPEWVAGFVRNQWPESIGIGGRLRPESVAGIERNMQTGTDLYGDGIVRLAHEGRKRK